MKSLRFIAIFLLIQVLNTHAQNLVPNPSFELKDSCALDAGINFKFPSEGVMFAQNWYQPTYGTSDYFNACSPSTSAGLSAAVPDNFAGTQLPHTGNAYAGSIYSGEDYAEYLESPLSVPLIAGHRYLAGFWINCAEISSHSASRFGIYFSADSVEVLQGEALLNLTPQIESSAGFSISDTIDWVYVSDTFIASGGERWLTIGNFHRLSEADTLLRPGDEPLGVYCYYYYDDVFVYDMDSIPVDTTVVRSVHKKDICYGESIIVASSVDIAHYTWNDGSNTKEKTINTAGTYWVKSSDTSSGRVVVDTFKIKNITCGDCIFVPNAFSPNGDGMNDYFKIGLMCPFKYLQLSIYNRFGQQVYLGNLKTSWDGNYNGIPCDVGTYFYIIEAFDEANKHYQLRGDIALIK